MFYQIIKTIARGLNFIMYRFEVTGRENIPEDGAFIICGNHISAYDPIAIAVFSKRQLTFMSKAELFKFPPLGAFLRRLGAFPVNRGTTDMTAYRTTMKVLKEGKGFLIFSQGTRMKDFENAKGGVAVFALKSGAPIIPVGIIGPVKFRGKIKINFGKAISMDKWQGQRVNSDTTNQVMEELATNINQLLDVKQ